MANRICSASSSITLRARVKNTPGTFGKLAAVIEKEGGQLNAIDTVRVEDGYQIRDFTIFTCGPKHAEIIVKQLSMIPEVEVLQVSDRTFLAHLGGKIRIKGRIPLKTRDDLSIAYTPGVARICDAIHKKPEDVFNLTIKKNMVAVVSDGSAVLGLGNIGPYAAIPVMEGKALLFKEFANVDAFPICLDTQNVDEIVATIKHIAPVFGGINLEDISAPRCFEVEERLKKELDIPVFHDDQHGTAVVLAAAMINALKLVQKKLEQIKVVVVGIGAAGTACTKMLINLGVKNIIGCDCDGVLYQGKPGLHPSHQWYAEHTNPNLEQGTVHEVIKGADVFIGVSKPGVITAKDVKKMNKDAIVFAMANPIPEIMPEDAKKYAAIVATGRSDYPNQINNVLCFPGMFRGVLDCMATRINEEMKLAAAYAIANSIEEQYLSCSYIIPSVFDTRVVKNVAQAVKDAAIKTGVARKLIKYNF
ncbi:NAD-dependent malic enzyme [Legionella qingyii]|uniref:NADP-dependent malic enzyme n=2 Tax=Legionella qingyii TaxID=2184757 RepID=A0A317U6K7_9GAMM|nr:malic enzyme-like NAD(P)-binding protein [Legionella qingyii]PWY56516.1 NAD-dependent malic enzyme [Legionella qingyii]PWY57127.1 NAD-dependent malic enzyme [Legionella qingyii]RUR25033.1 NAD-dependent malic enzyme [Legionella qingyii]RUR28695.1 NAD-dependent malic enzyme [Legionella qingyii]